MKWKTGLFAGIALLAGIAASIYLKTPSPDKPLPPMVRLVDMQLPDLDGNMQRFAQWQGKVLLVNFWATWCPPCRKEMPMFMYVRSQNMEKGFEVVGISIDEVEKVLEFKDLLGIDFPLLDGEKSGVNIMTALGNSYGALPYSVLFDRTGSPVHFKSGEFSREELEKLLDKYL